jgi:dihydrofolate reductase
MWNLISLDGLFEGEKNWDLSFHERAWGPELERLSLEQLNAADMLIFGRVTYEGMAAYWQKEKGAIADFMNSLPKLVCSRTLVSAAWNNSIVAKDGVAEVARRKREGDGDMYVFGSAILSQSLMNADLFDEYRIGIAPGILGRGRHLFGDGLKPQGVRLVESRPLSTGCVVLFYRPEAGEAAS